MYLAVYHFNGFNEFMHHFEFILLESLQFHIVDMTVIRAGYFFRSKTSNLPMFMKSSLERKPRNPLELPCENEKSS